MNGPDPMTSATSEFALRDIMIVFPELILAVGGMLLLMIGVFRGDRSLALLSSLALILLVGTGVMVVELPVPDADQTVFAFGNSFIVDSFATYMKVLVLAGSGLAIVMSLSYLRAERMARFEYPVLIVFATLGMLMMISANDFINLYVGLELQSLSLYVLAAIKRDSARATEAGLKYFVLGALSSGLLLYGISLIYGFSGTTNFEVLAGAMSGDAVSLGTLFGLVFVAGGLAFKISAVPFHMWTPDVYEGAPTPVTAFFASAPKVAAMALVLRTFLGPLGGISEDWQTVIVFISIASMVLGAFAAIGQTNIKRLMAYSSISHMGYALTGLAAAGSPDASQQGVSSVMIYMAIYLVTVLGTFVCILSMRRSEGMVERIDDLAGLARTRPMMSYILAALMFSLMGLPPFAGFLAKYFVFSAALKAGLVELVVIGAITSVIGAFYYLRIVKVMFFDDPAPEFEKAMPVGMTLILTGSGLFVTFFIFWPAALVGAASIAAAPFGGG